MGYHCYQMGVDLPNILTGAGIGSVLTTLIVKALEKWNSNRSERKRLRNALYVELGQNFEKLFFHLMQLHNGVVNAWTGPLEIKDWERREVYDQALASQPILLQEIHEARLISDFYLSLEKLKTVPPDQHIIGVQTLNKWVVNAVNEGNLSRRKLLKNYRRPGSPFHHPLHIWANRKYNGMITRNVPKTAVGHSFSGANTIREKMKAIWIGMPGKDMGVPPENPVGKRLL